MPNIADIDIPITDIKPTELGVDSAAAAGRRLGVYGSQIAAAKEQEGRDIGQGIKTVGEAAETYMSHREINTGSRHGADLMANLNQSWNDFATGRDLDPNDPDREAKLEARQNNPSAAQQWREEKLEPALEQFKSSFLTQGGQDWAERFVDGYRDHATIKAAADMSTIAGQTVKTNVIKTVNSLASATFNDPSTLDFAKDALNHAITGTVSTSHNITPDTAGQVSAELKQQGEEALVKAAVQGAIVKGGNWQKIANDPKNAPYIKPDETTAFLHQEQFYQHAAESEARTARQDRDYQNRNDFNGKVNALEAQTMPQNVGDQPRLPSDYWQTLRDLAMHPGASLEPGRLRTMVQNGDAITARLGKSEPLAPISHATTMDLLGQMRSGSLADNGAIYRAYGDNKLNNQDFNFLQTQFNQMRSPEGQQLDKDRALFFKRYSNSIDPYPKLQLGARQPLYEAEMDARRQEGVLRAKGLDPHLVYDPRSEYFFGDPKNLQKYGTSLTDALRANGGVGAPDLPVYTAPSQVKDKAGYDALAPGTPFIDQDGKKWVKPAASVPAPDERKVGQVYPTPKGPMQWTGTGWVPQPPIPGDIRSGYRFKGGNPADQKNWEPAS